MTCIRIAKIHRLRVGRGGAFTSNVDALRIRHNPSEAESSPAVDHIRSQRRDHRTGDGVAGQRRDRGHSPHEQVGKGRLRVGHGQDAWEAGNGSRGRGGRSHHSDEAECDDDSPEGDNREVEGADVRSSRPKGRGDGQVVETENDSGHCAESHPGAASL